MKYPLIRLCLTCTKRAEPGGRVCNAAAAALDNVQACIGYKASGDSPSITWLSGTRGMGFMPSSKRPWEVQP